MLRWIDCLILSTLGLFGVTNWRRILSASDIAESLFDFELTVGRVGDLLSIPIEGCEFFLRLLASIYTPGV